MLPMNIFLIGVAFIANAVQFTVAESVNNSRFDDIINYVNNLNAGWKAGRNKYFDNIPMDIIRHMMGVKQVANRSNLSERKTHPTWIGEPIPDQFDAREKWPNCPTIKQVYDQGNCGSDWAVAIAAAISDRICIASSGKKTPRISAIDLLSCFEEMARGCDGIDSVTEAWGYYRDNGTVTGGPFNDPDGCKPYPFPPCNHSADTLKPCEGLPYPPTPECAKECQKGYNVSYEQDKYFARRVHEIDVDEMYYEILNNGPVVAVFEVYEDFFAYKSGVYIHLTGDKVGPDHAVKMIGWGIEDKQKYWLAINSFNDEWGDKGAFKILRGVNHCHIESELSAGWPK